MQFRRRDVNSAVFGALLIQVTAGGLLSCSAGPENVGEMEETADVDVAEASLTVKEEAAVARTLAPIRALETPEAST